MKKNIRCENCVYFDRDKEYRSEGKCKLDDAYTREHRVCNKPTVKVKKVSQKYL